MRITMTITITITMTRFDYDHDNDMPQFSSFKNAFSLSSRRRPGSRFNIENIYISSETLVIKYY